MSLIGKRRRLKERGEIWRSKRIETLVHYFNLMETSASIKRSKTKCRPQSRRGVQLRTMKDKSASIVDRVQSSPWSLALKCVK